MMSVTLRKVYYKSIAYVKPERCLETIAINVTNPEKSAALLQLLRSMNFVVSAEHVDTLASVRRLFNEINQEAAHTPLTELSYDDIQAEIDAYRRGH